MRFVLSVIISLHMSGISINLAVLAHDTTDVAGIARAQSVSTKLLTFIGVLFVISNLLVMIAVFLRRSEAGRTYEQS